MAVFGHTHGRFVDMCDKVLKRQKVGPFFFSWS